MARVVDVEIFDGDIAAATGILLEYCSHGTKDNRLVSATGAHGIVTAHRDQSFRTILSAFYLNLPDGMPAVWTARIKGARHVERCYGPDFFKAVLLASAAQPIRHYLCGGKDGVARELQHICGERFNNPNVVGIYSPPFLELNDQEIIDVANDINSRDVDIVWVGLSTPKQERLAYRLAQHTRVHFLCTVGAAFDFHTGRLKQAPRWLQRLGLEWLFRLLVEPGRLWKRYLTVVPLLLVYGAADLWRHFTRSRRSETPS